MKRRPKLFQQAIILILITSLFAPAALGIGPSAPRMSAMLAEMVAEDPSGILRVIVQKADDTPRAEHFVEQVGGQVLTELNMINAFAAQLPTKSVPKLASMAAVNWVYLDAAIKPAAIVTQTETLLDLFDSRTYTNNDGTQNWLSDWVEINDDDRADGGKVKIDKEVLKLEDKSKGIQRSADLSMADTAILSLAYRREKLDKPTKYINLEISSDDGTTWTEVYRFQDGSDADMLPFSLDISAYTGANVTLRFLTSPDEAGKLFVDNFVIEYTYGDSAAPAEDPPVEDPQPDPDPAPIVDTSGNFGVVYTVRDEFDTGDFSGQDGLDHWVGDWVEDDPADVDQNPAGGYIQMLNGELRINNQNYDNTRPSVTRAVALSWVTSANLSFDYRTAYGVDIADGIAVEISPDGGASWILLDTIENLSGITSGSVSYDITPFATADTLIRVGVAYFYGLDNEYFYVDNLEVAYTFDGEVPMRANLASVADNFNQYPYTYSASNGTEDWLTDWVEIGDDGQPLSGDVHLVGFVGHWAFTFWTDAGEAWQGIRGIQRSADLSDADWAEVSFLYRRGSMEIGDFLYVEASTDGGATWHQVGYIEGKGTQAIAGSDQGWRYAGFDISDFISAETTVRLITNFVANDYYDNFYLEDVTILFDRPSGYPPPNHYLDTLNVRPVWEMGYDGSGVTVAVVDSGVALDHDFSANPGELNANRVLLQLGFNQDSTIIHDAFGHGTHVAGIIGGNGSGSGGFYQGVAPGVNLISLKVSDDQGMAYESDTVEALQWIFDHKDEYNIRVVNLSIQSTVEGYYGESALNLAAEILWFNGVVVVASAGNEWSGEYINTIKAAPANDPFIITVGASNEMGSSDRSDDVITPFTARGVSLSGYYKPEIIAPGKDIVSTLAGSSEWRNDHPDRFVEGGYFRISGTSMATPMVAGAAALLLQAEPDLTPDQVKFRLVSSSSQIEYHSYLDVYAAVTSDTTEAYNWYVAPHQVLAKMALVAYWTSQNGEESIDWENVDWAAVNWNAVNWNAVNWNAVNWNAVNWNAVNWNAVNWNAVNWSAVNWNAVNWNAVNWNAVNWNAVNWNAVNWNAVYWDE
jgi:serine protease AprX